MIRIQNIYHMLSYAFRVLQERRYVSCATEPFENVGDLLAAILVKGVSAQIKRGLARSYVEKTEPLSGLRGKIDMTASVKSQALTKQQLVCTYDEFSEDSYMNRVLKTTMVLLLHSELPKERKKELRNLLLYFRAIGTLDAYSISWKFRYHRNNETYRMLMGICYLVIKGLLQTTEDGKAKLMHFLDDQRMSALYEKFILGFYQRHYPRLLPASSPIKWALDDDFDDMLPAMKTDIMLRCGEKKLIIDAKYYAQTMQVNFDHRTVHSANLYQIFAYVKNEAAHGGVVSGLLLYAGTDEEVQLNQNYRMNGNQIGVKTLDLNRDFSEIAAQLNEIAAGFSIP